MGHTGLGHSTLAPGLTPPLPLGLPLSLDGPLGVGVSQGQGRGLGQGHGRGLGQGQGLGLGQGQGLGLGLFRENSSVWLLPLETISEVDILDNEMNDILDSDINNNNEVNGIFNFHEVNDGRRVVTPSSIPLPSPIVKFPRTRHTTTINMNMHTNVNKTAHMHNSSMEVQMMNNSFILQNKVRSYISSNPNPNRTLCQMYRP